MPLFTKESLETLRKRVDLFEVLSAHLELKRAGASYKALCPFHDEKTPSFILNKGDTHYHCFGCGAHGDAIQFLMEHQRLNFHEAVESLAQRFAITLEVVDHQESEGPRKADLKAALEQASRLYHFLLLHTQEGHEALHYLFQRGLDLSFVRQFQLGLAPKVGGCLRKLLHAKAISDEVLLAAGLLVMREEGGTRDFFHSRIMFPIRDAIGAIVGFSARKYREETYGGKYINTSETPIFKKSHLLFGLNECRKRIGKEQRAIIVEGQIDALRLISLGLNITVAGLGTAFGEGHVAELISLGVKKIYLALDSDRAGQEATRKIGNLFQKQGIEVFVTCLPAGDDPDSLVRREGIDHFIQLLEASIDYLTFLVRFHAPGKEEMSPAAKTQLVETVAAQIRAWDNTLMIHESLRKLAHLMQVPQEMVGVGAHASPHYLIRRTGSAGLLEIDPDRILESDLLYWLVMPGDGQQVEAVALVKKHLKPSDLRISSCVEILTVLFQAAETQVPLDTLSLMTRVENPSCQELLAELSKKRVPKEKKEACLLATIQRILDRNWMEKCELLRMRIQSGQCNEEEVSRLMQEFTALKRHPPKV